MDSDRANSPGGFNDFIIPDEDVPINTGQRSTEYSRPSGPPPSSTSEQSANQGNFFTLFVPKVDLSSTFAPFTASTDNNKIKERQFTGGDTLDEPVWETLKRDFSHIGRRLFIVVWPMSLHKLALKQQLKLIDFASQNGIHLPQLIVDNRRISVEEQDEANAEAELHVGLEGGSTQLLNKDNLDWDLWGPLVLSLLYSVTLGLSASGNQTNLVFSGSFSMIWLFYVVVGLNIQLLGGTVSFMSAISAVGYSMFPIAVGELLCALLIHWKLIRLILMAILNLWSIYAGVMSLKCSGVLPGRVLLAIYPVGLMYSVLSWLVVIT